MERYEPFDLKIGKLTGTNWDRGNMTNLAKQLMAEQGEPRASIENRIVILFDRSTSSSIYFLQKNRALILQALSNIVWRPYAFTHWIKPKVWCSLILVGEGQYNQESKYYEHPIGIGLREPQKANFEFNLVQEMARISGGLLKCNPEQEEHGHDGDLLLDNDLICDPLKQSPLYRLIPVCEYGDKDVEWANCNPCPLFRDEHCLSRGARFSVREVMKKARHQEEKEQKAAK